MLIVKYDIESSLLLKLLECFVVEGISIDYAPPLKSPSSVTLWSSATSGIRIFSKIFDTPAKNEVGYLAFSLVSDEASKVEKRNLGTAFGGKKVIEALTVNVDNCKIWAGLRIFNSDNEEIKIVAHAFPYSMTAKCSLIDLGGFEPEFAEDEYLSEICVS